MLPLMPPHVAAVLARFLPSLDQASAVPIETSGSFSGADIWRVTWKESAYALRAWPPERPSTARIVWIHEVLRQVARRALEAGACVPIPVPVASFDGRTLAEADSRRWELAPWLPGVPADQLPATSARIAASLAALARFHQAAVQVQIPCPDWESLQTMSVSPGILERRAQLERWQRDRFHTLEEGARRLRANWPEFAELAERWVTLARDLGPRVAAALAQAAQTPTPLQICLRDIKSDHLLFVDERVTGIVDFGAMRPESVAADLARLLHSFPPEAVPLREAALQEYQTIRPLTAYERWLIDVFGESGTLLSAGNWVEWVAVQSRQFARRDAVLARFGGLVRRLQTLPGRR